MNPKATVEKSGALLNKQKDFNEYVGGFPPPVRRRLKELRAIVRKAAPEAEETISYGMPAFKLNGMLVWFAAHRNHIGFYPRSSVIAAFGKELAGYRTSKGTVQFPLDKPLPVTLVTRMVKYGATQNLLKTKAKKS